MKHIFTIFVMLLSINSFSQKKDIIYLWPEKVPGETKDKHDPVIDTIRKDNVLRFSEVTNPAIEVFLPEKTKSNSSAVVVCPGGGYQILAYDLEGTEIAAWLNKLGYTAFVLQYRIPDKKEGAIQDAQRALRVIRSNSGKWNLDPEKIGIMGFSAGASLSARTSTLFNMKTYSPVDKADSLSCRPSFTMLIYPAYLDLGPNRTLTPELQLSKDVPPMYIFQTADDKYGNSALVMAGALRDADLPVELHFLPKGGHGYGLRQGSLAAETWPLVAEKWLKRTVQQQ
ncbi:MAG TPA: alpha/beta hydrolase [Bacteroidales bacterium]|nr:alpha/beta hydrolase [Bacteroidales bacterium]